MKSKRMQEISLIAALLLSFAAPSSAVLPEKPDSASTAPVSPGLHSAPSSAAKAVAGSTTTAPAIAGPVAPGDSKAPRDSTASTGPVGDSAAHRSLRLPTDSAGALRTPPASVVAPADTFNPNRGMFVNLGAGFYLGSSPAFTIWQNGLAEQLSDLRIGDTSFRMPGDSGSLSFTVKKEPDIYNIIIPISVGFGFISPTQRLTAGVAFSWESKNYDARISKTVEADSLDRHIDIHQGLKLYTLTVDLTYGRRIPEPFFSIDGIDRTDFIIGLTGSPYIGLTRSGSIGISNGDERMAALRDSILSQLGSFTAAGFSYGWRIGIATMHHTSNHSGLAAEITYTGMWSTRFRAGSKDVTDADLGERGSTSALSYYSSRVGVTVSLFRKVGR